MPKQPRNNQDLWKPSKMVMTPQAPTSRLKGEFEYLSVLAQSYSSRLKCPRWFFLAILPPLHQGGNVQQLPTWVFRQSPNYRAGFLICAARIKPPGVTKAIRDYNRSMYIAQWLESDPLVSALYVVLGEESAVYECGHFPTREGALT